MTKFMINNRTDARKTGVNLLDNGSLLIGLLLCRGFVNCNPAEQSRVFRACAPKTGSKTSLFNKRLNAGEPHNVEQNNLATLLVLALKKTSSASRNIGPLQLHYLVSQIGYLVFF